MRINRYLIRLLKEKYPNWDISISLRYLPIVSDIRKNFKEGSSILDVGSGDSGLYTYIKKGYKITATDIDVAKITGNKVKMVQASAEDLPFKSDSFDAVVSVDMMEHLPEKIREGAISEMIRVARDRVYIAFPRGSMSYKVDKFLSKYYFHTHKKELEFLNEHIKNGLPDTRRIERFIKGSADKLGKTVKYTKKGNTNLFLWLVMLLMGFSENKFFTNIYNKLLFILPFLNLLHFWPSYRVLYIVELRKH
jgi:ubiquinone/menaquinone biosynthesis C-methylase UbiE